MQNQDDYLFSTTAADLIELGQMFHGQPCIAVSHDKLSFGTVRPDITTPCIMTIKNTGRAELILAKITNPALPFRIDRSVLSHKLAPGQKMPVLVSVTPSSEGCFESSFQITSNDPISPILVIDLSATAGARAASATATAPTVKTAVPNYRSTASSAGKNTRAKAARPRVTSTATDYKSEREHIRRRNYVVISLLSVALVVGMSLKLWPQVAQVASKAESNAGVTDAGIGGRVNQSTAPRQQYTVEELRLPQEISPAPIKPAPAGDRVPVDESWADLSDDSIPQEELDELPTADQEKIIERREKIKLARQARARRQAASSKPTSDPSQTTKEAAN
jgi:Abnormal spindle-like microcephaly-assoc'd, ASPM-SPD-2-Hydin